MKYFLLQFYFSVHKELEMPVLVQGEHLVLGYLVLYQDVTDGVEKVMTLCLGAVHHLCIRWLVHTSDSVFVLSNVCNHFRIFFGKKFLDPDFGNFIFSFYIILFLDNKGLIVIQNLLHL